MKKSISSTEIPLPNEIPFPESLKKDPATEELLTQNQDLMARLTIALRRAGDLEKDTAKLNKNILFLKEQNHYISETSLLHREQLDAKQKELTHWKEKLKSMETDYALLYQEHNGQTDHLHKEIQLLKSKLNAHQKFRRLVKEKVRPFIQSLQAKIGLQKQQIEKKEIANQMLKAEIVEINKAHSDRLEQLSEEKHIKQRELQERLSNLEELLYTEEQAHKNTKNKLKAIEAKNRLMQSLDDEYTIAKNRSISLERSRIETERKFELEIRKLQKVILELREKSKDLEFENRLLRAKTHDVPFEANNLDH